MILVDTSAWVEFLRATGSDVHQRVRRLVAVPRLLATTDVVVMEVLAGARSEQHAVELRALLTRGRHIAVEAPADYEEAASLYRRCRRHGTTIRSLTDCLIAVTALRADVSVLHHDRDFDAIAGHTPLKIESG